jgi:phosphoglycerate dehydrogenase-like enzyme
MPFTVLTSFALEPATNDRVRRAVEELGGTYLSIPVDRTPTDRDERIAHIDAHITEADVFYGGRLSAEQWERAARLKWIHVPWAGVNTLLSTPGIAGGRAVITNSSGIMADSVADQTMGSILMLTRDLAEQVRAQDRAEWVRYETESPKRTLLRGRTMGILGYGAIGRAIATRARAFGMRVIATRRTIGETPAELDAVHGSDELDTVLREADILVIALPLTPETRGLLGREQFAQMKRDALLVNIARGAVVVESELADALRDRTIAGAALDVFDKEPLPSDSPFWSLPNVLVTPHTTGAFKGFGEASATLFLENLRRWVRGEELRNVVRDGY